MIFKRLESMSSVKISMYWDFHFSYKYTRDFIISYKYTSECLKKEILYIYKSCKCTRDKIMFFQLFMLLMLILIIFHNNKNYT